MNKCEKDNYHTWSYQSKEGGAWLYNIESTTEDYNTFEGTLTCEVCGATCEVTGDWEN